jgi:hypothetical protein
MRIHRTVGIGIRLVRVEQLDCAFWPMNNVSRDSLVGTPLANGECPMSIFTRVTSILGLVLLFLPMAVSAEDKWEFQIVPYLWFAGIKGDASTIPGAPVAPIEVTPKQALEDTKASYMGLFDAKYGRHGGFIDALYTDVRSDTVLVPSPINLTMRSTSRNTLVSAGYSYELYKKDRAVVDAFLGARYWEIDTQLEFGGGLGILAGQSVRNEKSWVDPLIGIRARTALGNSNFFVSGLLSVGGFGVGSDSFYDVSAHLGYQFNKTIGATLGYRLFDVKYEDGSFLYDVRQDGWLLGVSFAF